MGVIPSALGFTPICNDCGVCLCWDISREEYAERPAFWDAWRCRDCDTDAPDNRKRYIADQGQQHERK